MALSGSMIGLPFTAEGFAFFLEAVFLGLYLYGWVRLSPVAHWLCAIPIAISGAASSLSVVMVNAWMNYPAGFHVQSGQITQVDPVAAALVRHRVRPSTLGCLWTAVHQSGRDHGPRGSAPHSACSWPSTSALL
jgi:cytochrome bd-type quinol oxidase subunit 1